ncbi:hypothetical protein B5X24_HaOG202746 [Helicoverpa armigera]|uniref:Uncharacterized protein n=1 Tax=Helicoverpa armigera TaxID=29058 RepID=A0A2W1BS92_HELAM|nr:hypothetical protein B5X24_HaOG202746 [Helicoverpa armigera]
MLLTRACFLKMWTVFCFCLLFNFCFCVKNVVDTGFEVFLRDRFGDDVVDNQDIKDQKDSIIRPCRLHDTNCIRHFFAQDFQCLPTEGPVHDPLELQDSIYVPVPHANLTYILNNPIIRGLNKWKIEEFFINKDTQRLVFEVVFDRIDVTCPQADLIYHRKGKEPLKGWDSTFIEYKDLSFTLTISYGKDAKSFNSHVYTFIPDAYPKYSIQPATHEYKGEMSKRVGEWVCR